MNNEGKLSPKNEKLCELLGEFIGSVILFWFSWCIMMRAWSTDGVSFISSLLFLVMMSLVMIVTGLRLGKFIFHRKTSQ